MWKSIKKNQPPHNEIVWLFLYDGIEIVAIFRNDRWEHPNGTQVIKRPTHWKRMGT